jgi:hypothetical protein
MKLDAYLRAFNPEWDDLVDAIHLLKGHLGALRANETATYARDAEGTIDFWVATELGIYGLRFPKHQADEVTGSLTPWSAVDGCRLSVTGSTVVASEVGFSMSNPEMTASERGAGGAGRDALLQFAETCIKSAGAR